MENDKKLFQFCENIDLPIYVELKPSEFEESIFSFFKMMNFTEVEDKNQEDTYKRIKDDSKSRVLILKEASFSVSKQIEQVLESDKYGAESIVPRKGYSVYRHKSVALMVYSLTEKRWEVGVYQDFGGKDHEAQSKVVISRFLSLALASHGIIGFWGTPVDEGIVVMKQSESLGEAIFLDIRKKKVISLDGIRPMRTYFKIIRLDKNLEDRDIVMTNTELLGFLNTYCTYLDFRGHSVPIRQMIFDLSRKSEGIVHPQSAFRPRVDLSLS